MSIVIDIEADTDPLLTVIVFMPTLLDHKIAVIEPISVCMSMSPFKSRSLVSDKKVLTFQRLETWSFKIIVRENSKFADWLESLNDKVIVVKASSDIDNWLLVSDNLSAELAVIENSPLDVIFKDENWHIPEFDGTEIVPEKVPEFERLKEIKNEICKVNKADPELSKIFTKTSNEDTVKNG